MRDEWSSMKKENRLRKEAKRNGKYRKPAVKKSDQRKAWAREVDYG